eukprot:TRINITY_DN9465_c0_g1_i1.p1 TRINITY_DN9465_c0_g1~~TRINITY_DN9465_c0_g1_i1.p1  ORF type:complete len:270 (-),score=35.21 TRINITY_DN9465_c0_g1_i1:96-875(-)
MPSILRARASARNVALTFTGLLPDILVPTVLRAPISSKTQIQIPKAADQLFRVEEFIPSVDKGDVTLIEGQLRLSYKTPAFRSVTRCWKAGLIQVLTSSFMVQTYDQGTNGWDFLSLPVSDSSAFEFPFYGPSFYRQGPGVSSADLCDEFSPNIALAMTRKGGSLDPSSQLLHVERKQSFRVWLAAYDAAGDRLWLLRQLQWDVDLAIKYDTTRPSGSRAILDRWNLKWKESSKIAAPEVRWLQPPHANAAQMFRQYGG